MPLFPVKDISVRSYRYSSSECGVVHDIDVARIPSDVHEVCHPPRHSGEESQLLDTRLRVHSAPVENLNVTAQDPQWLRRQY